MFSIVFLCLFSFACNNSVPNEQADESEATPPEEGSSLEESSSDSGSPTTSDDERDSSDTGDVPVGDDEVEPQDLDEDGFTDDIDCNDHDPRVHPGASEFCDGLDTDCDGIADPNSALDALVWYRDADGDGFGNPMDSSTSCAVPGPIWVENSDDCDDDNPMVHPDAEEVCDGIDNDCDGLVDPDSSVDASEWFMDTDEDGFGIPEVSTRSCALPDGLWVADDTDCDDTDGRIHPGAEEMCDGVDSDCDGVEAEGIATWKAGWRDREDVTDELESGFFHRIEYGELQICGGVWQTRFEFEISGMSMTSTPKVSIRGVGSVIIDGNDEGRLIMVDDSLNMLELHNLMLRNGAADRGAGLYAEDLDLTLEDVRFNGNNASGPGGAIFIEDGSIVMDSVDFDWNTASGYGAHGGAIRLQQGSIEGSAVSFQHNEAVGMASGGAICLMEGTVTLDNAEFSQNEASYKGGAIKIGSGNVTLLDSEMFNNSAMYGGGLYVGGSVDLVGTKVSENAAIVGGGLYLKDRDGWQDLTCDADGISQAGFVENEAESRGGAVYIEQPFGTTWESIDCDWGTGSTDNGPVDIETPLYAYNADGGAHFSCTNYTCEGSIYSEMSDH